MELLARNGDSQRGTAVAAVLSDSLGGSAPSDIDRVWSFAQAFAARYPLVRRSLTLSLRTSVADTTIDGWRS